MSTILTALEHGAKSLWSLYKENSPRILTGVTVTMLVSTAVSTGIGTVKAVRACDKAAEEKGSKLTFGEMVKVSWKYYIWAGASVVAGTAASIGACTEGEHKTAVTAAVLQSVETNTRDIVSATKEVVTPEQEKEIDKKVAEKQAQRAVDNHPIIYNFGTGEQLWIEPITGALLQGDQASLDRATFQFNNRVKVYDETVTWSDWWDELGVCIPSILKEVHCENIIEFADPLPYEVESLHRTAYLLRYKSMPLDYEELKRKIEGRYRWDW